MTGAPIQIGCCTKFTIAYVQRRRDNIAKLLHSTDVAVAYTITMLCNLVRHCVKPFLSNIRVRTLAVCTTFHYRKRNPESIKVFILTFL